MSILIQSNGNITRREMVELLHRALPVVMTLPGFSLETRVDDPAFKGERIEYCSTPVAGFSYEGGIHPVTFHRELENYWDNIVRSAAPQELVDRIQVAQMALEALKMKPDYALSFDMERDGPVTHTFADRPYNGPERIAMMGLAEYLKRVCPKIDKIGVVAENGGPAVYQSPRMKGE